MGEQAASDTQPNMSPVDHYNRFGELEAAMGTPWRTIFNSLNNPESVDCNSHNVTIWMNDINVHVEVVKAPKFKFLVAGFEECVAALYGANYAVTRISAALDRLELQDEVNAGARSELQRACGEFIKTIDEWCDQHNIAQVRERLARERRNRARA